MHWLIILKVALRSLRRTALRSSLTALGVIIGVAAVIALVSIGSGAKAQIERELLLTDKNLLGLFALPPRRDARSDERPPLPPGGGLTLGDYEAIRREFAGIAHVNLEMGTAPGPSGQITAHGHASRALVKGVDAADALRFSGVTLIRGVFFSAADVQAAANVCVLSQTLVRSLFAGTDPLGQWVQIGQTPFRVIGVRADDESIQRGDRVLESLRDRAVFVPYTSLLRRLDRTATDHMMILMIPENPALLLRLRQRVSDLMEERRGQRKAEFILSDITEQVERDTQRSRTLSLLLASIAGISLVVGGVGIMNIMLVSVTERTREIGIRLAIGTRERDVLRQFLLEAVILSGLGGAIGIVLGMAGAHLIGTLGHLPTQVTLASVLAAFLCSAGIGVFFGWYPARQAARLDPIEALRAE